MPAISTRLSCLVVAAVFAAAACTPSAEPDAEPGGAVETGTELPEGWAFVAGDDVATASTPAEQTLPAEVLGSDDVESQVSDTSESVVGGDDIIEIFDAVGLSDQVFAAPEESATQTGQNAPETFMFNASTGTEGVISLGGTVFIGNNVRRHSSLAEELRSTGMEAVVIDQMLPAGDKIRLTTQALGVPAVGDELADQVEAQYAEAATIATGIGEAPRVLHISTTGSGGSPTIAGADTLPGELIERAGGINVGAEVGIEGMEGISPEGVVQSAPDVVVLSENDLEVWGGPLGVLETYPTLAQTPAGENNAFVVMPDLQLKTGSVASGAGSVALAEYFAAR